MYKICVKFVYMYRHVLPVIVSVLIELNVS